MKTIKLPHTMETVYTLHGPLDLPRSTSKAASLRGSVVREYRMQTQKSLGQLAGLLEISVVELSEMERGLRAPESWDLLFEILENLEVTSTGSLTP